MSNNWITLVPENPRFVPNAAAQRRARDRFAEIAPKADKIEIKVSETARFFDCGANLERIRCPSCGAEIPLDWAAIMVSHDMKVLQPARTSQAT